MASFCEKCGFPQSAASAFCPQCGTQVSGARYTPGAPAPVAQAPLPPATGGSGLKIVMVVLVCFGVLGVAAIGGLYYVAHRVKQAVVQKAAENGVDLGSITSPVSSPSGPKPRVRKACDYLTKEEVSNLIGEPVERAKMEDSMCMYLGAEGLTTKLAQDRLASAMEKAKQPNPQINVSDFESLDQVAKAVDPELAKGDHNGETPLLMLGVDADGKPQMTAITASNAIFSGIFNAANAKGMKFSAIIPNLGDKAVRLPKMGLNVLKGEVLIRVIPGPFPDSDAKSIEIAKTVMGRL